MYCVYLLTCSDDSLYCGIAKNLGIRLLLHNQGIASRYTRRHLPVQLLCAVDGFTRSQALKVEYRIKQCHRKFKEHTLLQEVNSNHERISLQ